MEIKAITDSGSSVERECENLQEFVDFLETMGFDLEEIQEVQRIDV